jgi:peptide/nickel transport system permease protein
MSDDLYDPSDRPLEPTDDQPLDTVEASDAIRDKVRMDLAGGDVGAVTSGGLWRTAGREVLRKKSAIVGMALLSILLLLAVFAPIIAPYPPNKVLFDEGVSPRDPPCVHLFGCDEDKPQHILGIDGNGRDYFSRIVYGARVSLLAAFVAVLFAVVWGTMVGLVAGFFGGWVDNVLMRVMDVLLSFPSLLLAIVVVTVLGPGLINAILAIAIVTIPQYARIVRSSVLSIREQEYVSADQALGVTRWRLLAHRIFPNTLTPLIVIATLGVATAVLEIASLSFLGLGIQPPTAEWGSMLAAERNQVFTAPHLVFFAGLMIMWNVLGFNLLGDGLRDAIDPRLGR